ncbi:hypothetical protein BDY19DRAFT_996563 [Irpex rosettiformis]|uniref:Uncharacterized protein n=1 Tax=Irpex rosettiformis TaxID=378272 RepID=A0ACB8TUH6_9APHY|nr:hypothetical protein BDY19DRAFT_996563 [Irpex rosettiformis]
MESDYDDPYFYGPEPEDDEAVEPEPVSLPDEDTLLEKIGNGPGHLCRTMKMTRELSLLSDKDIALKMVDIINFMAEKGMDVATFLHYLSWNVQVPVHMASEEGVIRHARTALMSSPQLSGIIEHWLKPPRKHLKGISTLGAKDVLERWAVESIKSRISSEMREFSPHLYSSPEDMSEDTLLSVNLKDDIKTMKATMPTFWDLMVSLGCTTRQLKLGKYKDHEPRIFIIGTILQYNRSQNYCRYQKELSIYLKACGLGGKAGDTTHLFGLTMSQSWVHKGIAALSESNRQRMLKDIAEHTIYSGHDNLNLSFKVFESRKLKQTRFDSGTAGTVYIVKNTTIPSPSRLAYQNQRAIGSLSPITVRDVYLHEIAAAPRLRPFHIHLIKRFLLDVPHFVVFEAQHPDDSIFCPPPPIEGLPTGPENATCQYMLDTVPMEEASQDGNRQVLEEWLRQLKLDGDRARSERNEDRLLIWIGDQLTTIRIRFLKRDRSFDMNFLQRFEQILEIFGWFHAMLATLFSLHKQYYGTSTSFGLKHAFDNMGRKGLERTATQGNFYYTCRQANINALVNWEPEELEVLAAKILDEFASNAALEKLKSLPAAERDQELEHSIQFCQDLLNYLNIDDAIKTGDVGRMEQMLPRLLFRFHGAGSHNYAHEILELMQGLWKEWPLDLKKFTLFAAHGPFATWDYIKRISASIPTQRKLKDHIEREFNHFRRYKGHTSPDHEGDVSGLQEKYHQGKVHVYQAGRKVTHEVKDIIAQGSNAESLQGMITRWANGRVSEKSTMEDHDKIDVHLRRMEQTQEDSDDVHET